MMNKLIIVIVLVAVVAGGGYFLVKNMTRNVPEIKRSTDLPSRDTSSGSGLPARDRVAPGSTSSGSATQPSGTVTAKPSQTTIQDVAIKLKALDSASSDFASSNSSMNQVDETTQL